MKDNGSEERFLSSGFLEEVFYVCVNDKKFFDEVKPFLLTKYIPLQEYKDLWEDINHHYDMYDKKPSLNFLKLNFKKNRDVLSLIDRIKEITLPPSKDDIIVGIEVYLKRLMFLDSFQNITKVFNSGKREEALSIFIKDAEKFSNFSLLTDIDVTYVFREYKDRDLQRELDRDTKDHEAQIVPIGISELDKIMFGGPRLGETTMFCGRTGTGKSLLCIWAGISAAKRGKRVLHFQLEGKKQQVTDRYDAAWTGTLYSDMRGHTTDFSAVKIAKINKVLEKMKGDVLLKTWERFEELTLIKLRTIFYEIKKNIGDIDLVIIDYFELLQLGDRSYAPSEERARQDKLGRALKAFAVEANTHVLTPTQANDINPIDYNNARFFISSSNLSEHRTKIKPFDNFFSINMTDNEYNENLLRIFVEKLRDHEAKKKFTIKTAFKCARFYDNAGTKSYKSEQLLLNEKYDERTYSDEE